MSESPLAKKSLGQHWLSDPASLQAMCDAADIDKEDVVLEIGPGLGTLTELLVKQAKQVIAVEFDSILAANLPHRVPAANLQVVSQDIMAFDFSDLPPDYKIVANIPYYLTSNLIRMISEAQNRPKTAALLVQKEVAERVAAKPGAMSLLSITAQFYWQASLGQIVPAKLFTPSPKVDSQILILRRLDKTVFPDVKPQDFFRLTKAGFSQRRKTLLNSLSGGLNVSRDEAKALCERAFIDCALRPQTLSLEEWRQLYLAQTFNA
ncbi:MAG TPA: 16S rRNA (adenine(1518)-N(6)/adenine(1519)-N(6))-dimethyltransferase RsmA [Candidatus Saccharimonadales bacterium]|jgi:16S rRNA (adenine1518-N6/adenine1519-N6)-dimethyltransferase|nr:16S rRNA (adenine(1518)-N(6)/adenine(1519)-N(6))-dimethyltransferase RsmA [Candidatus Saccharimonadales bacterium]